MFILDSETITEEYKASATAVEQWKFSIPNGNTGEMNISDPLLDTVERATERAKSEFLKNSYKLKVVNFTTHRTDIAKNMIINVHGLPYLVKEITTNINLVTMKANIRGVRYE